MKEYFLIIHKETRQIIDLIQRDNEKTLALRFPIKVDESITNNFFDACLIAIRKHLDKDSLEMIPCPISPGTYYSRVYKPCIKDEFIKTLNLNKNKKLLPFPQPDVYISRDSIQHLKHLIHLQKEIFNTVHPDKDNFDCYGMTIRNLLILSCTEIETQFRGILIDNGIEKERFSTNDFVKLEPILKLKEYSVKFRDYPWFGVFSPFQNWDSQKPTTSLFWYDNYNAVKHDRYLESKKGNLISALMAIISLAIVLRAQFENEIFVTDELDNTFDFGLPNWKDDEKYIPPHVGDGWRKKMLFK